MPGERLPDANGQHVIGLGMGLSGNRAIPKPLLAKLNADMVKALETSDLQKRLFDQGIEATPTTAAQFAAHIKAETEKWARAIREAGIRAE